MSRPTRGGGRPRWRASSARWSLAPRLNNGRSRVSARTTTSSIAPSCGWRRGSLRRWLVLSSKRCSPRCGRRSGSTCSRSCAGMASCSRARTTPGRPGRATPRPFVWPHGERGVSAGCARCGCAIGTVRATGWCWRARACAGAAARPWPCRAARPWTGGSCKTSRATRASVRASCTATRARWARRGISVACSRCGAPAVKSWPRWWSSRATVSSASSWPSSTRSRACRRSWRCCSRRCWRCSWRSCSRARSTRWPPRPTASPRATAACRSR